MANQKRKKNSSPLKVLPCSHQDGKARYPGKNDSKVPTIAHFRNNLTALSQYRNLIFVAYVDKIHVFQPRFPDQIVPSKPELIIEIPTSRPGLRGYLDRRRPHAINHLIVGNLGDEEMLLAACDDGDVVIYNLRSIDYALDQGVTIATARRFGMCRDGEGRHRTNLVLPLGDDAHVPNTHVVEPWFLTNVGASAWGLAVHESARMFAVSSNTKLIKVFAPALGNMHCPEAFVQCGPPILNDEGRYTMRTRTSQQRMFDLEINLEGHQANIPNIAFCNTGFDPEGIYLVSTDIEGSTFVWDIWCGDTVLEMHDRGKRGWGVACLDPRSSRLTDGNVNTFGCTCPIFNSNAVLDISEGARSIPDNSHFHPGFQNFGSVPGATVTVPPWTLTDSESGEGDQDEDQAQENEIEDGVGNGDGDDEENEVVDEEEDEVENEDEVQGIIEDEDEGADVSGFNETDEFGEIAVQDTHMAEFEEALIDHWGGQTEQQVIEGTEDNFHDVVSEAKVVEPFFAEPDGRGRQDSGHLCFNLLHTSERDVILCDLQNAHFLGSSINKVYCKGAIHQAVPPGLGFISQTERLNMVFQVPELGMIAIGSPAGRVGLFTMTTWQAPKQPGYKIECILPFKSQEEKGMRPTKLLMGMAIGPIQGQETAPPPGSTQSTSHGATRKTPCTAHSTKRFRLFLTYYDHTILSYEISRPTAQDDILVV